MKVKFNENEYDIQWQYEPVPSASGEFEVVRTTCTASWVNPAIERGREKYEPVTSAFVTQNPIDQHVKRIARKLSLTKMLSGWLGNGPGARTLRTKVWKLYLERK